jgi:hypothetical protein
MPMGSQTNHLTEPDNCSHSDCGCFVAGYDLSGGELSQLVLDSSNCTLHIYNEENEGE